MGVFVYCNVCCVMRLDVMPRLCGRCFHTWVLRAKCNQYGKCKERVVGVSCDVILCCMGVYFTCCGLFELFEIEVYHHDLVPCVETATITTRSANTDNTNSLPGALLNTLQAFTHLFLLTALISRNHYYSQFIPEKNKAQRG